MEDEVDKLKAEIKSLQKELEEYKANEILKDETSHTIRHLLHEIINGMTEEQAYKFFDKYIVGI